MHGHAPHREVGGARHHLFRHGVDVDQRVVVGVVRRRGVRHELEAPHDLALEQRRAEEPRGRHGVRRDRRRAHEAFDRVLVVVVGEEADVLRLAVEDNLADAPQARVAPRPLQERQERVEHTVLLIERLSVGAKS